MARTGTAATDAARSATDTAAGPGLAPSAGDSPAAAVRAALSAEPGDATAAVSARNAQVSVAAARQALIAHEKAGTVTRTEMRKFLN